MAKRVTQITTMEELKNILVLGLDLWVLTYDGGRADIWTLKSPRLTEGARGPKLGSNIITDEYVNRWGITDGNCHHSVHTYGHPTVKLFATASDAQRSMVTA